jgi:predicted nucleotidyltransferase
MTEKELYIMKQIGLRIQHKDPEADVILFGSHARGQAGEESDWDILILINGPKKDRSVEDKYRDEMFQLELELGEPISTLIYSKMDWETKFTSTPLYQNIKKEGLKIT